MLSRTTYDAFDEFYEGYIQALTWSSGVPMARPGDVSGDLEDRCIADCEAFLAKVKRGWIPHGLHSTAGHDFALTRNRHGAGFWDGDWPVNGEALTALSHEFPEITIYRGDDDALEAF